MPIREVRLKILPEIRNAVKWQRWNLNVGVWLQPQLVTPLQTD